MKTFVMIALTLAATAAFAEGAPQRRGFETYRDPSKAFFMPPNALHLFDRRDGPSNITEQRFHEIIDAVMAYYVPLAKARGVDLVSKQDWNDPTVNASAEQWRDLWQVNMYGGLARRPEVTPDGFVLVVCHEIGHHFGGYPFTADWSWAANEGQSDYFATLACARTVWARDIRGNESFRRMARMPLSVIDKCSQAWPNNTNAQGWCARVAAAGLSMANLFAQLGGEKRPSFDTPDTSIIPATTNRHPGAQCRLDTYFASALCTKAWDNGVIPGRNINGGQASATAEIESMKYTCSEKEGFTLGVRPRCWFKPRL